MVAYDTLTLNVGGTCFTTQRETLLKEPGSKLATLARGTSPSSQDRYFIDRDPKHFQLVLNWLRDGWCAVPSSAEGCAELLIEARHYQLKSFESWIQTQSLIKSPAKQQLYVSSPHVISPNKHTACFISSSNLYSPRNISCNSVHTAEPVAVSAYITKANPACERVNSSPAAACQQQQQQVTGSLRDVFFKATAAGPIPAPQPAYAISQGAECDGGKWTAKYLKTNETVRQVVNTLLELAYLAPHQSLTSGKVAINITPASCDHDKADNLVGGTIANLRKKTQHVSARSLSSGWSCEFPIRPDSDPSLFDKYNIAELVQDNWFVLTAIFKDQFGILLEDQGTAGRGLQAGQAASINSSYCISDQNWGAVEAGDVKQLRPACPACRRHTLAITLHRIM